MEEQLSRTAGEPSAKEYREQFRKLLDAVRRKGKEYFAELAAQKAEPELGKLLEVKGKVAEVKSSFGAVRVPRPPPVVAAPVKTPVRENEEKLSKPISDPFAMSAPEKSDVQDHPKVAMDEKEQIVEEKKELTQEAKPLMDIGDTIEIREEKKVKQDIQAPIMEKKQNIENKEDIRRKEETEKREDKAESSTYFNPLETTRKDINDSIKRLLQEEQELISQSVLSNPSSADDEPSETESNQAPFSAMKHSDIFDQNTLPAYCGDSVGPSRSVATIISQYADVNSLQAAYQRKKEELADCEQKIVASEGELAYCKSCWRSRLRKGGKT